MGEKADDGPARISRRDMLEKAAKGIAIAGAVQWVPPVIESFTSPAAATVSGGGALSFQYDKANNGNTTCGVGPTTTTSGTTACNPSGFAAGQTVATNETTIGGVTKSCGDSGIDAVFTVPVGHTISAGERCSGTTHTTGVLSNSNRTITFAQPIAKNDIFRFVAT